LRTNNGSYRGVRGGSFNNNDNNLHAANRNNNPTNENNNIGFRVAEAPEPPIQGARKTGQTCVGGIQAHAAVPCSGTTRPSGVSADWRAGKEEGSAVASSRKAKGAAGPHSFQRDGLCLLPCRSNWCWGNQDSSTIALG